MTAQLSPASPAPRSGIVATGSVDLAYGEWPGGPPPIVAIHGLTASHVNWIGVAERLDGRHRLWAPDLRGRGGSDKPAGDDAEDYGMAAHALDVISAVEAFGIGPAIVLGHSMGAYVGAEIAARRPDLVLGLLMLDGGYLLDMPPELTADQVLEVLLKPQVDRLGAVFRDRAAYRDFWRSLPAFDEGTWNPWVESYADYDVAGPEGGLRPRSLETAVRIDFRALADKPAVRETLRQVRCPVAVIRAEHGVWPGQPPIIPDQVVAELRAILPGLEETRLEGATHYTIALADPWAGRVADLAADFARRHGGG